MKGPNDARAKRRSPSRVAVAGARGHDAPTVGSGFQKFEGTSKWQPSACRYQRLLLMTWTPAPAWRTSRWQHATPGAAAAARPRHKHVCAGCPRRSVCRQRGRRVNARTCICTSLARCATTAQLWNRWPDVRAMCPAPTPVARRPSLYREQSPDDRRQHGSAYSSYTTTATLLCTEPVR